MGYPQSYSQMTRYDIIADIGCLICRQPPQMHHLRGLEFGTGTGKKASNDLTIGLCMMHHTGNDGYHHSPATFEAKYGTQANLLEKQNRLIADYCIKWGLPLPKK